MPSTEETHEALRTLLHRQRIAKLDVLCDALGTRSRMTVFRRLREVGYLSSYSHRGRYYTLADIPRFDANGLWFYQDVGFSRCGTLKDTVADMVPEGPAGSTQTELARLLRVRVHNTLLDLVRAEALGRQVVEGVGEFIYVSADPRKAEQQIARRLESLRVGEAVALPPTETVMAILAEALRASRVGVTPDQLARRLSGRGMAVSREEVERVFEHYNLLGGKKNRSLPPRPSSP